MPGAIGCISLPIGENGLPRGALVAYSCGKSEKETLMTKLMKVAVGLAMVAPLVSIGAPARAQQQPQPLKVTHVKDNVYWVQGGVGSNDGFIVGTTGVVLVDTKSTVDSEKGVIAAIAAVTPKAVNTAIITHSDNDHVNGLAALPAGL